MRILATVLALGCMTLALLSGCSAPRRSIRFPTGTVRKDGDPPPPAAQPYVIKWSDGRRTYQIEIPMGAGTGGFRVEIPLGIDGAQPGDPPLTEADRDLLRAKRERGEPRPEEESEALSYYGILDRVRRLYRARQYDAALIDITRLDRAYPDDVRILEMKGTLHLRLGQRDQARAAWSRVLELDPDNQVVLEALQTLEEEGR